MTAWESDISKAPAHGAAEHNSVLHFYSPEWIGCKQMDAVTFPDRDVSNSIIDRKIPLRAPLADKTRRAEPFQLL